MDPHVNNSQVPIMSTLDQTVSGPNPADDLAYLQEKLLRDKFLKIMSYTQKKKKKKKKKDKDPNLPHDETVLLPASTARLTEAQNSNVPPPFSRPDTSSSFLLKALTGFRAGQASTQETATLSAPKSLSSLASSQRGSSSTSSSTSKDLPAKTLSAVKTHSQGDKRSTWFNRESDNKVLSSSDDSESEINRKPVEITKQNGSGKRTVTTVLPDLAILPN
jgi:hypothetical protein